MTRLYFSLPGKITLNVSSDSILDFGEKELLLLRAYLPGIKPTDKPKGVFTILSFNHIESNTQRLTSTKARLTVYDSWNGEFPLDFYHLVYSFVRKRILQSGYYSVHAACVTKTKNILILGHTGVGKTTSALELVRAKKFKVFSGNKTVCSISKSGILRAISGTKTITLNEKDLTPSFQSILAENKYGARSAFMLDDQHYTREAAVTIDAIVLISLNDGVSINKELEPSSAMHTIYPYFLDVINADTQLFEGKAVFSGEVSTSIKEVLTLGLSKLTKKVPTFKTSGSLAFVTKSIEKL